MKNYTTKQKKDLRDKILAMQEASGLSGNQFATERLGFSNPSKFSHIRNGWDKAGMVGTGTWEVVEKYIQKTSGYKVVLTDNLKKVWNACERAYNFKKPMAVIGEGGFGKTQSLIAYKEYIERLQRFNIVYFDAKLQRTPKSFTVALMETLGIHKPGKISKQLDIIRQYCTGKDMLLMIDEVSDLESHNIIVIKYIMDALKDVCGIVFTGTPYFINNLNRGALRDRHLFSETRDRLFMLPEMLTQPSETEAEQIFRANGINDRESLNIVMGRIDKQIKKTNPIFKELQKRSWQAKKSFRGIRDCIDMVKMSQAPALDFDNIQL